MQSIAIAFRYLKNYSNLILTSLYVCMSLKTEIFHTIKNDAAKNINVEIN